MKKETGGTLGKKSSHKCVQELCIHPSLKPIPCTGQGEPRWRTALARCRVLGTPWCLSLLSPAMVTVQPCQLKAGLMPSWALLLRQRCQPSTPLALPIWPPPGPLSSFSGLQNAARGGKFQQAAEHSAKLTKDLCIVCLIHGHFGIPILKPQTKSHKSHFHLDLRLLFPPNAPWQAAQLLPNHRALISSF